MRLALCAIAVVGIVVIPAIVDAVKEVNKMEQ